MARTPFAPMEKRLVAYGERHEQQHSWVFGVDGRFNEGTMFEGFPYTITPVAEPFLRREEFQKLILKRKG
jgi:hypothetical protein